jgi:hypothetical protein
MLTSGWKAMFSAWEDSWAAATTIAARAPMLLSAATGTASPQALREVRRMYSEKYLAAVEGAMAAGQQWLKLWMRTGMAPWGEVGRGGQRIVQAAMKPARRTAKANARRLKRRPTRRR